MHPTNGEIYFTLTNNSNRKLEPSGRHSSRSMPPTRAPTATASPAARPAAPGNINGHIIRMAEAGGEPAAAGFNWDVYLFGAQADAEPDAGQPVRPDRRPGLLQPDGLWFSQSHRPVLDPDRRRRVHRRHQLHDAGGVAGPGGRRREHDAELHQGRRQHAESTPMSVPSRPPTHCAASWSARSTARSLASPRRRMARRCSSTSSTQASRSAPPRWLPAGRTSATGPATRLWRRRCDGHGRARPRSRSPRTTAAASAAEATGAGRLSARAAVPASPSGRGSRHCRGASRRVTLARSRCCGRSCACLAAPPRRPVQARCPCAARRQ